MELTSFSGNESNSLGNAADTLEAFSMVEGPNALKAPTLPHARFRSRIELHCRHAERKGFASNILASEFLCATYAVKRQRQPTVLQIGRKKEILIPDQRSRSSEEVLNFP